eukprot:CAMPEP_0202726086 /NCGR_PEP_ID=MMETSP1385-20130828/184433_1 /ASSEMBLY_ACC=CAM_ASM_000861 /TAXON_ID=933848 /ORGANISM="Elphidium margaritaceum" /LENGTH=437 /DNA_ID=CAMNT_0049392299 /DNA_START=107 /DNA_END=1420 /DNA_ORIENTATION=+
MWSISFVASVCIVGTLATASEFSFWDRCQTTVTDCVLSISGARYAYASAYSEGASEWYLLGGMGQTQPTNMFETLDSVSVVELPSTASSSTGFACSSAYASQLPQASSQGAAAAIDGKLIAFGGFGGANNNYSYIDDVFDSSIATQSAFGTSLQSMPVPWSAGCSVTVGQKVYFMGGLQNGVISGESFVYDTASDSWTALTVGQKVYFMGGLQNGVISGESFVYDTVSDSWTALSAMTQSRFAPGCSYYNEKIYVFGGQTAGGEWGYGDYLDSVEIYDIASQTWSLSSATLSYQANWMSTSYLSVADQNLVVVMGGASGYPATVYDNLDVYDIDNDAIIARETMPLARYAFQSITLPHGEWNSRHILIAGGKNADGEAESKVEMIQCSEETIESTTMEPTTMEPEATTTSTLPGAAVHILPTAFLYCLIGLLAITFV